MAFECLYSSGAGIGIDAIQRFTQRLDAFNQTFFKHHFSRSFKPTRVSDRPESFHWLHFSMRADCASVSKAHFASWFYDIASCASSACKFGDISIGLRLRAPSGTAYTLWLGSELYKVPEMCRLSIGSNGFLLDRVEDREFIKTIEQFDIQAKVVQSGSPFELASFWSSDWTGESNGGCLIERLFQNLLDKIPAELLSEFTWNASTGINATPNALFDALSYFPSENYILSGDYRIDKLQALDFVVQLSTAPGPAKHAIGNFESPSSIRCRLEVWTDQLGHRLVVVSRIPLPVDDVVVLSSLADFPFAYGE